MKERTSTYLFTAFKSNSELVRVENTDLESRDMIRVVSLCEYEKGSFTSVTRNFL